MKPSHDEPPRSVQLWAHLSLIGGAALVLGLADATMIAGSIAGARGAFQHVPASLWLIAPWCWLVCGLLLAAPASLLLRRRTSLFVVIAMVLLLVAGRAILWPAHLAMFCVAAVVLCTAAWAMARRWLEGPRRASALIAAAFVAAGIAVPRVVRHASETPAGPVAAGPDVVVVFLDTVPHSSVFGQDGTVRRELPTLQRLAAESVVFDRAYTTAPWTLPAHFSAVTGLPAHRLGLDFDDQRYDLPAPTLAERFRRRGYRTAAVISNSFLNRGTSFQRGFDSYEQAGRSLDLCRTVPGALADRYWPWFAASVCNWTASEVTDRAIAGKARDARPLFLLVNYMDAHDPYYVESECRGRDDRVVFPREVPPAAYRARYYEPHLAALRCIDRSLARLVRAFGDHAVFAVLADHGEQFGEHGLVRHGNSLYAQLLHVPLMVRIPGRAPQRVSEPVSIAALTDLLEGRSPSPEPIHGYLRADFSSAISGRWHLIRHEGREELFDLVADPAESAPAAGPPEIVAELRQELRAETPLVDREQRSRFRSLGYVH